MAEFPLPPTDGNGPVVELQLDFEGASAPASPIVAAKVAEQIEAGDRQGALHTACQAMTFTDKVSMCMAAGHFLLAVSAGEQTAMKMATDAFDLSDEGKLLVLGLTTIAISAWEGLEPDHASAFLTGIGSIFSMTEPQLKTYLGREG